MDITEYRKYTKPAELHKAVNLLRGLVAGISCDEGVSDVETTELTHWCTLHSHLKDRHPFSELVPLIESALQDGIIEAEEKENILWLCNNFIDDAKYYDIVTSSIQFLHGLIHGIMSDGTLRDSELNALRFWLENNEFLCGTYPFDELNSLLHDILSDGIITDDERNVLLAFFSNVIEFKDSYNLVEADFSALKAKYSISGICAFCPEIDFKGKTFCFTGESYRAKRSELAAEVERLGGTFKTSVSSKTDYLIVGNAGNPCWAYACYGRKIEEAMAIRKKGGKVQIINETDFWDAVWDAEIK